MPFIGKLAYVALVAWMSWIAVRAEQGWHGYGQLEEGCHVRWQAPPGWFQLRPIHPTTEVLCWHVARELVVQPE